MKQLNSKSINWEFYTASAENIAKLTKSTGFRYKRLEKSNEYAHSPFLIFINNEGKVSRYITGIQFDPFDFKMAILESIKKEYRSAIEQGLLFCYNYNPEENSYGLHARNLMKFSGILTILFIIYWIRRSTRKGKLN